MEIVKTFTEEYDQIGVASREDAHTFGYWHEVFHCWVLERIGEQWHIYLQLRSKYKKDYPRQFDITAAGHLMADETIEDGVRELKEELGVDAAFSELHSLGVIPYKIEHASMKDFEFAHVFCYIGKNGFDQFTIQDSELDGMYRLPLAQFIQLMNGTAEKAMIEGYEVVNKEKIYEQKIIALTEMETLPLDYRTPLVERIVDFMGKLTD